MYQKSAEKLGETDTSTLKYKQNLNEATAVLNNMERELASLSDEVDETGDSLENAGDKATTFGDVLKANVLSQAVIKGFEKLVDMSKELAGTMIENAASIKAETSQFSQTFGEMSGTADKAIGNVAANSGILQTRLNTLGSQIYAFARASGGSATESMQLMKSALQATADSAAYYDRSLEDTADSLQSFLKGNYENDAALGLSATETTRNAAAMEAFGKKFNDLTEIQKQQTLLKMVTDAQELSGAMGQAAREADGWENVTGNLSEAWRQFTGQVGAPLLEQLVPVIQQITAGLTSMTDSVDWDAFGKEVAEFVGTLVNNGPEDLICCFWNRSWVCDMECGQLDFRYCDSDQSVSGGKRRSHHRPVGHECSDECESDWNRNNRNCIACGGYHYTMAHERKLPKCCDSDMAHVVYFYSEYGRKYKKRYCKWV